MSSLLPLLSGLLLIILFGGPALMAQEYLDTAGRWKRLVDPSRAGTGGFARAIGCARGGVIVSRDNGTLLVSSDSGETFHDLRAEGTLDTTLKTVWAIAWPDTVGEPNRVVAISSVVEGTARPYVRLIESSNGGFTYSSLKISAPKRMAALHRTTDGGRSWKWTYTLSTPYHFVTGLQAFGPGVYRMLTPDMNSLPVTTCYDYQGTERRASHP